MPALRPSSRPSPAPYFSVTAAVPLVHRDGYGRTAGRWRPAQTTSTVMLFASLIIGITGAYSIKALASQRYTQLGSTPGDRV